MKNVMNRNRAAIIGLVALVSTAFVNPVSANTKADPPGVEVKYVGYLQSNPVFEIILSNPQSDSYFITIRDQTGNILFSEKLKGKNISRKYRIDTEEEIEEGGLTFEVRSANTKKTDVYTVGVTATVKRDMAVSKVE
jgi:hypothetical protein